MARVIFAIGTIFFFAGTAFANNFCSLNDRPGTATGGYDSLVPPNAEGDPSGTANSFWPHNHQIIQRTPGTTSAWVHVAGCFHNKKVQCVEAVSPDGLAPVGGYYAIPNVVNGCFDGYIPVGQGGMYSLKFRGFNKPFGSDSATVVSAPPEQHFFGVGEVFLIGGQSNSTNSDALNTSWVMGNPSRVMGGCYGINWSPVPANLQLVTECQDQAGGSSAFARFGDIISSRLQLPVGLVPVGWGGLAVASWLPGIGGAATGDVNNPVGWRNTLVPQMASAGTVFAYIENQSTLLGKNSLPAGNLYNRLRSTAQNLVLNSNGFRAFLWDQGESDSGGIDHAYYINYFQIIISTLQGPAPSGIGRNFPTLNSVTSNWVSPNIFERAAQASMQKGGANDHYQGLPLNILPGPDTDSWLPGLYRCGHLEADPLTNKLVFEPNKPTNWPNSCVHLNDLGETRMAEIWYNSVVSSGLISELK